MSSRSEAELIALCRKGDAAAWDDLFGQNYAAAGRFIMQFSPDLMAEDIEEICQETFLAVIKNLNSFHGGSRLQTWIFRIAANKARDHLEKQRTAKRGGGAVPISLQAEDPNTGLAVEPPSHLPGPDKLLMNKEGMRLVAEAVAQLSEPCREVVELRYFADLSYEEISSELKLNQKTVSSRLSKCLDHLERIAARLFCREKTNPFPV